MDTVVGPGGEPLCSLAETMTLLHLSENKVRTLETNEVLHRVVPAAMPQRTGGRGREPTIFYARREVEACREDQLYELGAVDAVVVTLLDDRRTEAEALRAENERLTERLARLTLGVQDGPERRLEQLEQLNRDLRAELTLMRKANRQAIKTTRSLAKQLTHVMKLYDGSHRL